MRSGTAWTQQAYVKSTMTRPNVLFGYSVGVSENGNTLAVAEYDADRGKGALYVLRTPTARRGHTRLASRPTTRRTGTRSGIRWPSATMGTRLRRARRTKTA